MLSLASLLLLLSCALSQAQLAGEYHRCDKTDGDNVEVPGITNFDPCIVCSCVGGRTKCQNRRRQCEAVSGCFTPQRRPGQCCDQCSPCRLNGTSLRSGERRRTSGQPCQVTLCHDGVLTQYRETCDTALACDNPVIVPGQCCPVCLNTKCELGGHLLKEGEVRADPASSCRECRCEAGLLACSIKTCPVLSCPPSLQKTEPGQCCPVCTRTTLITPSPSSCFWHNKFYKAGASLYSDTCTSCSCSSSLTPTCSTTCQPGSRQVCHHRGQTFSHGASWSEGEECSECQCRAGEVHCSSVQCPQCPPGSQPVPQPGECCPACRTQPVFTPPSEGVCTVFGDPHYKTFDGKIFNFQGSCKYLLTRDCSPAGLTNNSFSIRITNDARDTVAFSWLRTVTVRLGTTKVSLLQRMRVKVDGKKVTLPYIKLGVLSVMRDGYRVILRTNEGARLLWDGVSFLELSLPAKMRGQMCGLCGNFNGDKRDDFRGRHGALLSSGQEFGNSWRVGGRKACSVLPRDVPARPPTCRGDWQGTIKSELHCSAIKSSLFSKCHAAVPPQFYFKACRIDMCECPGTQCHCEVLTAYARECERAGVRISSWREQTGCRNVKPFKYSGEHFSGETSASSDLNATLNEVITSYEAGGEVFDSKDSIEPIDLSGLRSLPAYRYRPSKKEERKRERRKEKRRRLSQAALASYKGLRLEVAGAEGQRKRLKWSGRRRGRGSVRPQPPPFDLLLSSVSEAELVPHTSGEARTDSEQSEDSEQLTFSDLPSHRNRPPPPLHETKQYSTPVRRNYKRRHHS